MRAGATAAEVAISTGMDVEHVRRFEGPVLAERQWAVSQAQSCRIGWEKDSPLLGELVVDRLATRGVDPSSLEWDALREAATLAHHGDLRAVRRGEAGALVTGPDSPSGARSG